ncbi:DUF6550 family protein [Anaerotignum sp.]|uniref:DUF6550 family protein n=1 Tax=Anaerotignum sp. TaxID=2039241 RepID=UPI00289F6644|nr:DUF6550 family protein [Anaerotignum sp.]
MLKKKVKIATIGAVAVITSALIIMSSTHPQQEPTAREVCPVSALVDSHRDNTPSAGNKAVVTKESPEISTKNPPQDSTPIETDFELPTKADSKEILTEISTLRDNPTPTPAPSKSMAAATAYEPTMGDTRTVDGQKQVYFLGFGWIDDNEEPNQGVYVADMYENENKIGIMGGGTFVDGDGDINKMVGRMD